MLRAAVMLAAFLMFTTAAQAETTIPFLYVNHELLVDVNIDGKGPYTFLVDSGTSPSVIDGNLAHRLGLPVSNVPLRGRDISGRSIVEYPVTVPNVRVGGLKIERLQSSTGDLSRLSLGPNTPIHGVLGGTFFTGRIVQIDYACHTIAILSSPPATHGTAHLTKARLGYVFTDDAWVAGQRLRAMIDTGNSGTIVVSGAGVAKLHVQSEAREGQVAQGYGYYGEVRQTEGRLDNVRIGDISLGTMTVRFLARADKNWDLNVGNRTLEKFVATFDYVHGVLTLTTARGHLCARTR